MNGLGEEGAETLSDRLAGENVEALVDALADWPTEKPETLNERPVKEKTKALVDSLADTLAEKEPERQQETLGDLEAETLV